MPCPSASCKVAGLIALREAPLLPTSTAVALRALVLTLVPLLAACGAGASPDPNAIEGKFDVGGRSLYLECAGVGSPTIVMDAGLGNSHATWNAVVPGSATRTARVRTTEPTSETAIRRRSRGPVPTSSLTSTNS